MDDSTKNINEETAREETTCNPATIVVVIAQIPSRKIIVIPTLAMIQEMLTVVEDCGKSASDYCDLETCKDQKMLTVMETARQKTQNQIIVIPKLAKTQDLLIVMKSVVRPWV